MILDSILFLLQGVIEIRKMIFESALIRNKLPWPNLVPGDSIDY